jgi:hypothetical protein
MNPSRWSGGVFMKEQELLAAAKECQALARTQ